MNNEASSTKNWNARSEINSFKMATTATFCRLMCPYWIAWMNVFFSTSVFFRWIFVFQVQSVFLFGFQFLALVIHLTCRWVPEPEWLGECCLSLLRLFNIHCLLPARVSLMLHSFLYIMASSRYRWCLSFWI